MKSVIHRSETRGYADHGWLKAKHSFSFASWHNPDKMNFGLIRVLNDDIIAAGEGFGTHPHENMEIVTIPLSGAIAHKDSEGHEEIIKPNEVQVMSAGTGILHSEYNHSKTVSSSLFQVWIFPDAGGHKPRYDQKLFIPEERKNKFQFMVTPKKDAETLWLNQDAYFSRVDLDAGEKINYDIHSENNGVYFMLIDGKMNIADSELDSRDAIGVSETKSIVLSAIESSQILAIEVPMI